MPELPEVETTLRGLAPVMKGREIARVDVLSERLRVPIPKDFKKKVQGARVKDLTRRGKYMLLHLDNGQSIILHLGMSGRMIVDAPPFQKRTSGHDHVVLQVKDGPRVIFNDPRRFGILLLSPTKDLESHKSLARMGPEPFDKKFTGAYLVKRFNNKKSPVKVALMDQGVVAGIGNIYAAEALYEAKIHPARAAGSLKAAESAALVKSLRAVLKRAIQWGGSSLKDFRHADGKLGYFQHHFSVYDRAGQKCRKCGATIERIVQGGRSTFFCPKEQKLK